MMMQWTRPTCDISVVNLNQPSPVYLFIKPPPSPGSVINRVLIADYQIITATKCQLQPVGNTALPRKNSANSFARKNEETIGVPNVIEVLAQGSECIGCADCMTLNFEITKARHLWMRKRHESLSATESGNSRHAQHLSMVRSRHRIVLHAAMALSMPNLSASSINGRISESVHVISPPISKNRRSVTTNSASTSSCTCTKQTFFAPHEERRPAIPRAEFPKQTTPQ